MSDSTATVKPLVDLYGDDDLPTYAEEIVEPKSFRNRLINVLIWTTCLPLILLVFFQQKNFETASVAQDNLQLGLAREAALSIESSLSNIKSQLTLALSTYSLQPTPSARQSTFENILEHNPGIRSISYTDESGLVTTIESAPNTAADSGSSFGRIIALQIMRSYKNGTARRFLTARVDLTALARDFATLLYERPYAGAIFDSSNILIYATPGDTSQRRAAAEPFTADEIQRLHRTAGGPFLVRTEGDRFNSHIKAFVPIGSMGWTLVISQSQQVRDESMRDTALVWAIGFFIALTGTLILATLMSAPITKSINLLVENVENYGKTGQFNRIGKQLSAQGTTELVKLENTFARMVRDVEKSKGALRQSNLQLEVEVRARTSDLLSRNEELKTLQTLLAPLSSNSSLKAESSIIHYCIERFRLLLDIPSLVFETNLSKPAPGNSVDVRLGDALYGRLELPDSPLLTVNKQNSLERLAYALAIVTANAKLVERLSEEQAVLQTVFESMTDGVVIIGKSGLIRYANEYASRLLNEGESVLMLMFADLMSSHWESTSGSRITEDLERHVKTRVRRTRAGKGSRVLELLPFTVSDMPGFAGQRTGWILRDITQEASLEAVKENIVGVVAHELKTPLTLLQLQVRDLTRTIERGNMPEVRDVHELSEETLHLGQLVDDLLDVSRIRAGAMKLNLRIVHVESVIDRAEKLAAARYPMRISRHIDMDAELFCVDAERLTQVFVNLFNNAARYKKAEQKEALIDVSTRIEGQNIVIDVSDQGIGIAAGKIKHIFEQFYQADMTASRSHSGSGLGLTIVRGIILAHGGVVSATNNPEAGTRFTLSLPLSTPPELILHN